MIVQVRWYNLDARVTCPLTSLEFPGRPHQAAQTVARLEQARGETAAGPDLPALAFGSAVIAVGMGFQSPSMLSVISQLSDPADQGSMLGVSQSLGSLARIVGPLWGGFVFDRFGHAAPFASAAVVMSIACVLSLAAFRGYRPAHHAGVAAEPAGGVMNVSG